MEFVITADGSKTLYHPGIGEHYHSRHGAVQESRHVFVGMGLEHCVAQSPADSLAILEVGFGTGLNFLLSATHCTKHGRRLNYTGIEAFPLPLDTLKETGYDAYVAPALWNAFLAHYEESLEFPQQVDAGNRLQVAPVDIAQFTSGHAYDILYFDAFAAVHQPEMWSAETLKHICHFLKPGGIFVTYAITGQLKRTMKALGFTVEKIPGAPGKREMLRAIKTP